MDLIVQEVENLEQGSIAREKWNDNDKMLAEAIQRMITVGYTINFISPTSQAPTEDREVVAFFPLSTGTYTNFNNISIAANELAIITWNGSAWVKSASWVFSGGGGGTGGSVTGLSGNGNSTLTLTQTQGGNVSVNLSHTHTEYVKNGDSPWFVQVRLGTSSGPRVYVSGNNVVVEGNVLVTGSIASQQ